MKNQIQIVEKILDSLEHFYVKEEQITALQSLIDLAKEYQDCKGFPEERDLESYKIPLGKISFASYHRDMGFNFALHLCRVAHLKEVGEIQRKRNIEQGAWEEVEKYQLQNIGLKKEIASLKKERDAFQTQAGARKRECFELKSQLKGKFCYAPMKIPNKGKK